MGRTRPRHELEADYERTAREYCESLELEDFVESAVQAFQRLIFMVAFEVIHAVRPEVQPYSDLLIQYDHGTPKVRRQVVPDNFVIVHEKQVGMPDSFNLPIQKARPFFVLEYVSKSTKKKDEEYSHEKYEKELKVPYFLRFYPVEQELSLFRHNKRRYISVLPDDRERYAIPELEVELALVDGWVRFWFRGELMELPSELRHQRDEARAELARRDAEIERLRQLLAERDQP